MHELMFQAGVKGISKQSELIPCIIYIGTDSSLLVVTNIKYIRVKYYQYT